MTDSRPHRDVYVGPAGSITRERRVIWDDNNVPPGVIRRRDGKEFLDERELTDDLVRELGGKLEFRYVTPWEGE